MKTFLYVFFSSFSIVLIHFYFYYNLLITFLVGFPGLSIAEKVTKNKVSWKLNFSPLIYKG